MTNSTHPDIALLRSPRTIRTRCHELLERGVRGNLDYFVVHEDRLAKVAEFVIEVTKKNYPDLKIPYHSRWSHFQVGGVDRLHWIKQEFTKGRSEDALMLARMYYDLVVPSILVDAGAGMTWTYQDSQSGRSFSKSEGLAVASFDMFAQGIFSSDPHEPYRTDSEGLMRLQRDVLANGFQVRKDNPLVGIDGRLQLLKNLGKALGNQKYFGGPATGRVGALIDYLLATYGAQTIAAADIFSTVLEAFGSIWPGRIELHGVNLGDVWRHKYVTGPGETAGLIPFHKLSQWLTYSLLEPLEWAGVKITGVEELTGLAEYRNGGLFIDMGVMEPKSPDLLSKEWSPSDELVVEWRALTVALLDVLGDKVRTALGMSARELPLAKVLQGGTWSAGRQIAARLRTDGGPPIKIKSDGTVF